MSDLQPFRCAHCGANVELDVRAILDGILRCDHCGASLAAPPAMVFDIHLDVPDPMKGPQIAEALSTCMGQKVSAVWRDFVRKAPALVRCGASAKEAAEWRGALEAAGAVVSIAPCPGRHP